MSRMETLALGTLGYVQQERWRWRGLAPLWIAARVLRRFFCRGWVDSVWPSCFRLLTDQLSSVRDDCATDSRGLLMASASAWPLYLSPATGRSKGVHRRLLSCLLHRDAVSPLVHALLHVLGCFGHLLSFSGNRWIGEWRTASTTTPAPFIRFMRVSQRADFSCISALAVVLSDCRLHQSCGGGRAGRVTEA